MSSFRCCRQRLVSGSVWSGVISPPLSLRVTVMLSVSRSFVMASRSDRVMFEVVEGRVVR